MDFSMMEISVPLFEKNCYVSVATSPELYILHIQDDIISVFPLCRKLRASQS